jgi:hypothetical protein
MLVDMVDVREPPLAEEPARAFGLAWAEHWNSGDIEAVLAHYAEDCVFESPFAETYAGTTRVVGKPALRAYWTAALARLGKVHFDVEFVGVCRESRSITILYRAELGARRLHACERVSFGPSGLVVRGMGLYGPPVSSAER